MVGNTKILIVSSISFLGKLKEILNPIESIKSCWIDFLQNTQVYLAGYGLGICAIVGTVSLFLKILGFNTGKWALLAASTFIFIFIMI